MACPSQFRKLACTPPKRRAPASLGGLSHEHHLRKPSKEFMCELRKRIVARAHDHNPIATTGQPDQGVATDVRVQLPGRTFTGIRTADRMGDALVFPKSVGVVERPLLLQTAASAVTFCGKLL
jgi:hypothetical protein